jgi:hypothetical protein
MVTTINADFNGKDYPVIRLPLADAAECERLESAVRAMLYREQRAPAASDLSYRMSSPRSGAKMRSLSRALHSKKEYILLMYCLGGSAQNEPP